ncbi:MAG: 30S ribosome-binding factor RbfA [Actinomycetota bacterium]
MAKKGNNRGRRPNPATANRTARVGELIRRIVAEELEHIDDDRLTMVSITDVDVDRELHKAVIWFTTLDGDDDPEITEAFDELGGQLRKAVSSQARLRATPLLEFRADATLRSAQRIEELLASDDRPPVPDLDDDA